MKLNQIYSLYNVSTRFGIELSVSVHKTLDRSVNKMLRSVFVFYYTLSFFSAGNVNDCMAEVASTALENRYGI